MGSTEPIYRGGTNIGQDIAVLADLRGHCSPLESMNQDHLAADQCPRNAETLTGSETSRRRCRRRASPSQSSAGKYSSGTA